MTNRKSRRGAAAQSAAIGRRLADRSPAHRLHVQIMALVAGNNASDCVAALSESLANVVGFAAGSHVALERMLGDLAADMHKLALKNWPGIMDARRRAEIRTSDGEHG